MTSRNDFPSHAATNFIKSTRWCHLWQVWGQVRQAGGDKVDQLALKMPLGLMILWGLVTPEERAEVTFRGLHLFTQEMVVKSLLCCWARPQTVNETAESCPCGAYTAVISWGVTGDPHCLQAFLVLVLSKKAQESLASNPSVASDEGKCLLVPSLLSPLGLWTCFALACTSLCQHSPLPTLTQGVPTSPLEFRTGVPQTSFRWPLATGPGPAPRRVPLSLCISPQLLTDGASPSTLLHQGRALDFVAQLFVSSILHRPAHNTCIVVFVERKEGGGRGWWSRCAVYCISFPEKSRATLTSPLVNQSLRNYTDLPAAILNPNMSIFSRWNQCEIHPICFLKPLIPHHQN